MAFDRNVNLKRDDYESGPREFLVFNSDITVGRRVVRVVSDT